MKYRIAMLALFVVCLSVHGARPSDVLSGEAVGDVQLGYRIAKLDQRIEDLDKQLDQLHRNVKNTTARIECARDVMQVMGVAAVAFLGVIAIDYAFKKHKRMVKIKRIQQRLKKESVKGSV